MSGLCVLHCMAMPFVLIYLPLLGLEWLAGPSAHLWMLGLGVFIGGVSFWPGYRLHRRLSILLLAICGLGMMAYAATGNAGECCTAPCCRQIHATNQVTAGSAVRRLLPKSATPLGAAMLLTAHVFNLRCRKYGECPVACCADSLS